ncbi:hypothetical protein ACFXKW_32005 [Streptomyces sp. NPDC059193]|uniref:hypothetical protein n=1 Tax=Streptomyces sp. NPDC059193 TaxID=3346763 RepID=UPI0036A51ADA
MYPHATAPLPATLMPTTEAIIDRLLDDLNDEQLDAVARSIRIRRTESVRLRLLTLLREDSSTLLPYGLTDCPDPITQIRFTTVNDDYNPVGWDNNATAWHETEETTTTTQVNYEDTPVEWALRKYSGYTDPSDGARLLVDLATGEFTVRNPYDSD